MDEIIDIKNYKNPKIFVPKKTYIYLIILLIVIILLITLLFTKFEYYYNGISIVNNNKLLETRVVSSDVYKILNKNKIIIDNDKYKYKILEVSTPIVDGELLYQSVLIQVDNLDISKNTLIEFKIKYDDKTGFEIIEEFIFGKGK